MENTKNLIEVIKSLNPRAMVDKKEFPEYYANTRELLSVVYEVFSARDKGKPINESEAMTKVTAFLHTLGKANGKYISVCEATKDENGNATNFFNNLVYHSYKHKIFTISAELASLESEKAKASKKQREMHEKFLNGKATAKEYKEAVSAFNEAKKTVDEMRKTEGVEDENKVKESEANFTKWLTKELKSIIKKRYALTEEEAEAMRKLHNKETKEKRQGKSEAKPEAKTTKPKTTKKSNGKKAEAKKPETVEARAEAVKKAIESKPGAKATENNEAEKKTA